MKQRVLRTLAAGVLSLSLLTASSISFSSSSYAASKITFKDTIPAWAKSSVETAINAGILQGYPDGTFKPNSPISRAELLKVMAVTFGLSADTTASGAWYSPYKQALLDAKIYMVNDYTGDINKPVTRNEMAKLAIRGVQSEYRGKSMSAAELMFRAVNAGLLGRTGTNADTIDTAGTTTRAQAAVLISRLLKLKNGEKLTVDKGASTAAEVAWHRHNMITMFGQNDLVSLPYRVNIKPNYYDVIIDQLLILDPIDTSGYYSDYLDGAKYSLGGQYVDKGEGLIFAYKLKGKNLIVDPSQYFNVSGVSFYMLIEGNTGTVNLADKYQYWTAGAPDHQGLFTNRTTMRFDKKNGTGYGWYFVFVGKDYIKETTTLYKGMPIHLERYGKGMDKDSQFYLTTEVKDKWAE